MTRDCSICSKKETISDFAEGTTFTDVGDKTYCVKCFDDIEDSIIFCERCCNFEHINENFDETFVKSLDKSSNVIYYHIKCLFETEKCPICKDYLHLFESPTKLVDLSEEGDADLSEEGDADCALEMRNGVKNKECVYVDGGGEIEYHKSCVEDENNFFEFNICECCRISLRVKCESCERRFGFCYNEDCKAYDRYDEEYSYDGNCEECNW